MKYTKIAVDPKMVIGECRNILGINNSPQINHTFHTERRIELFRELGPRYVRHHDSTLENPGFELIDVSRIFPLFHLDANDPKNYDFKATDDYLKLIPEDATIEFRLGETIEHSENHYKVNPPTDYEKWADVCVNIIRHYTEGWADGFHFNIKYLSIYEEPNDGFDKIFAGPYDEYLKLFVVAQKKLKKAFPNMKVGGPATGYMYDSQACERFLDYTCKNGLKPDFISGDVYSRELDFMPGKIKEIEGMLKKYGCGQSEIFIAEWHLGPIQWRPFNNGGFFDATNAAFSASTLIRLMDTKITAAFYYAWSLGNWGCIHINDEGITEPYPVYYGLKFFTEIAENTKRVKAESGEKCDAVDFLAGTDENGNAYLLLSCYECEASIFEITVPGYKTAKMKCVSNDELNSPDEWIDVAGTDSNFSVSLKEKGSAVFLLEFSK
ncbi:MAG: hypothetical protein WCX81_01265 [Monoglobales bacterium]